MQSLFICHGAPSLAIEKNDYTNFLSNLGQSLKRPEAIVIFTAHWESDAVKISYRDSSYETIYDFGGFSEELYQITYPAHGSTKVADQLKGCFIKHGIQAEFDSNRGLDHGAWVVLYLMYPKYDIPVIQVSVNPRGSVSEHYKIGEALRELDSENILVIGSGATSHNLREVHFGASKPESWAVEFDDWLIDKIEARELRSLFDYDSIAPYARRAVPRNEHFLPLFVAYGAGQLNTVPKLLHRSYAYGTLSYICYEF